MFGSFNVGTEVTFDYGNTPGYGERVVCHCGSSACRGWVWFLTSHSAVKPPAKLADTAPGPVVIDLTSDDEVGGN
eukprot:831099-Rhodomonas_salina.1